ncbi:ATP-binding protein [Nocardiopsis tropica]|uniref:ATP-binding protein n=1 Tax=Nocardiopsis tropica TaxID=109330 RepID=A0ABU7KJS9_9ACTN|nr:ATP-binding protein [Nocardiopsis umidischolae]MEE2049556.1 ATP-binding protein [Nocardiopsis umidischolae]
MEQRRDNQVESSAPPRLPRRTTDPRDRAAILVEPDPVGIGHSLTLAGVPETASILRRRLASLASLPPRSTELLQCLASELFNNAITHSLSGAEGGEVVVTLHRLRGRVQVRVTDQGPRTEGAASPHVRPLAPDRVGGRGLRLVALQSDRWGTLHEDGRTTVWFELDRPGAPTARRPSAPGAAEARGTIRVAGTSEVTRTAGVPRTTGPVGAAPPASDSGGGR